MFSFFKNIFKWTIMDINLNFLRIGMERISMLLTGVALQMFLEGLSRILTWILRKHFARTLIVLTAGFTRTIFE